MHKMEGTKKKKRVDKTGTSQPPAGKNNDSHH